MVETISCATAIESIVPLPHKPLSEYPHNISVYITTHIGSGENIAESYRR